MGILTFKRLRERMEREKPSVENMSLKELRAYAKAFGVPFNQKMKKDTLKKRIGEQGKGAK